MGLGLLLADLPVVVAVDPLLAGHLLALRAVLLLLALGGLRLTALLTLRSLLLVAALLPGLLRLGLLPRLLRLGLGGLLLVAALRPGVAAGGMSGAASASISASALVVYNGCMDDAPNGFAAPNCQSNWSR